MRSEKIYLRIDPQRIAMFRFLLEAWDNLAYFTVLDRYRAVIKVIHAPSRRSEVLAALETGAALAPYDILAVSPD